MRNYLLTDKVVEVKDTEIELNDFPPLSGSPDRVPKGIEVDENCIYFYCHVGSMEALEVNRLLRRLDVEMKYLSDRLGCSSVPIHLHIHSSGGSVFAGLSITDAIKNSTTDVYTYIDGSAASAATLISTSGKRRFMSKNSFMLLHQPQLEWAGKLDEFHDEIENQKNLYEKLTAIYLENSNMTKEHLDDLLKHELWLDADKCLELGLIDEII
jgi:ATP-dependent protease ClpP protease subunit